MRRSIAAGLIGVTAAAGCAQPNTDDDWQRAQLGSQDRQIQELEQTGATCMRHNDPAHDRFDFKCVWPPDPDLDWMQER